MTMSMGQKKSSNLSFVQVARQWKEMVGVRVCVDSSPDVGAVKCHAFNFKVALTSSAEVQPRLLHSSR